MSVFWNDPFCVGVQGNQQEHHIDLRPATLRHTQMAACLEFPLKTTHPQKTSLTQLAPASKDALGRTRVSRRQAGLIMLPILKATQTEKKNSDDSNDLGPDGFRGNNRSPFVNIQDYTFFTAIIQQKNNVSGVINR